MKKTIAILLIGVLLTGCSTSRTSPRPIMTAEVTISPTPQTQKLEKTVAVPETQIQKTPEVQTQQSPIVQTKLEEKTWFAGAIGNAKIHAQLEITGNKVSGVYYYDQYKTNISLKGTIDDRVKDLQAVSLTEDTDKKGNIRGLFRSKDYLQGFWKSGSEVYSMYLIREGAGISPPQIAGKGAMLFDGYWTGKGTGYFAGSNAYIKVLFDDLLYYQLQAFNGSHSGGLDSFATIDNNIARTVFKDTAYDKKDENVVFEFSLEDYCLNLKSNRYDYMCGTGVGFDSSYTKGKISITKPTAQQVGIVASKEKDELFKKLVGDKYDTFISYTAAVSYEDKILDGRKVKAGSSLLRGVNGYCFYIISSEYIYAAILSNNIDYYTNDPKYANKLPQLMEDWATYRKGLKINYNFKE